MHTGDPEYMLDLRLGQSASAVASCTHSVVWVGLVRTLDFEHWIGLGHGWHGAAVLVSFLTR